MVTSNSPDNRWLLDAIAAAVPVIYFLGTSPGHYQPTIIPTFIVSHLPEPRLLDAAHILMDADEQLGQPIVSNARR